MADKPTESATLNTLQDIFILMDEMNVRSKKLYDIEVSKIPEGVDEEEILTVNKSLILDADLSPTFNTQLRGPWMSITLTNDGPDSINYKLNYNDYFGQLKINETRTINMVQRGKIRRIEITATGTETVRFSGVR